GRDIGLERLDQAIADADIAPAAQGLGGIEHLGAFDHEIELVVRSHGGAGGTRTGSSERACAGTGKKITAGTLRPPTGGHGLLPPSSLSLPRYVSTGHGRASAPL